MEICKFEADSPLLEKALKLRREVFVVEQGVPAELEIDEYDEKAVHFVALKGGEAVAAMRLVPHGNSAKIGRVAVKRELRRKGLGTALMKRGIEHAGALGLLEIFLDAQVDSISFYEKMGFMPEGELFDDAGLPHRRMRLKLP